jgi:hypothetical protein
MSSPSPAPRPASPMGGTTPPRPAGGMGSPTPSSPSGGMSGGSPSPQPYRPSWARDDDDM